MQTNKPTGLLTAAQISKSVVQGTVLNDIVKEHLIIIDKKILNATKQLGANSLVYDLPVTFMTTPSNVTDTKIMVYYHILKSLEERGYNVKINVNSNRALLTVEWVIGLDRSDIQNMEQYLQQKSV